MAPNPAPIIGIVIDMAPLSLLSLLSLLLLLLSLVSVPSSLSLFSSVPVAAAAPPVWEVEVPVKRVVDAVPVVVAITGTTPVTTRVSQTSSRRWSAYCQYQSKSRNPLTIIIILIGIIVAAAIHKLAIDSKAKASRRLRCERLRSAAIYWELTQWWCRHQSTSKEWRLVLRSWCRWMNCRRKHICCTRCSLRCLHSRYGRPHHRRRCRCYVRSACAKFDRRVEILTR